MKHKITIELAPDGLHISCAYDGQLEDIPAMVRQFLDTEAVLLVEKHRNQWQPINSSTTPVMQFLTLYRGLWFTASEIAYETNTSIEYMRPLIYEAAENGAIRTRLIEMPNGLAVREYSIEGNGSSNQIMDLRMRNQAQP